MFPGRIKDIFIFKISNCFYPNELPLNRFCYKASVDHIFLLYSYILYRYPQECFRQVLTYSLASFFLVARTFEYMLWNINTHALIFLWVPPQLIWLHVYEPHPSWRHDDSSFSYLKVFKLITNKIKYIVFWHKLYGSLSYDVLTHYLVKEKNIMHVGWFLIRDENFFIQRLDTGHWSV